MPPAPLCLASHVLTLRAPRSSVHPQPPDFCTRIPADCRGPETLSTDQPEVRAPTRDPPPPSRTQGTPLPKDSLVVPAPVLAASLPAPPRGGPCPPHLAEPRALFQSPSLRCSRRDAAGGGPLTLASWSSTTLSIWALTELLAPAGLNRTEPSAGEDGSQLEPDSGRQWDCAEGDAPGR